jgi:hypothetical protein
MCETMFFFSVQVCLDPWTVLWQADLRRYLFLGGKGMFLCFYVPKIVPVDTLLGFVQARPLGLLVSTPSTLTTLVTLVLSSCSRYGTMGHPERLRA